MPLPQLWPKSINQAWGFAVKAAKEGLTATESLRQYRAGGGAIRNEYWYDAFNSAKEVDAIGQQIQELPDFYTVNEFLATDSPFKWQREWVMQMEVTGKDPETQEDQTRWITVESNDPLTKQDYFDAAQDSIDGTPGSLPFAIDTVSDWVFYRRVSND